MVTPQPPTFLTDTAASIEARMVLNARAAYPDIDVSVGSFVRDAIAAAALEFARRVNDLNQAIGLGFVATTSGAYLDLRGDEHGIVRLPDETDAAFIARYRRLVAHPSASGSPSDYTNWVTAVSGVGGVSVIQPGQGTPPVGPNQVRLALVGTDSQPANLAVRAAVLTALVDPHRIGPYQAESFVLSGPGMSLDTTQQDAVGSSVLFSYVASGPGQATQQNIHNLLPESGIWLAKARIKVNAVAGTVPVVRFGVWDVSNNNWARTAITAALGTAFIEIAANALTTNFPDAVYSQDWPSVDFYYPGTGLFETRVLRLTGDTVTQVWLDEVMYRSAFSASNGKGVVPVGVRVFTVAAQALSVSVSATIVYTAGANQNATRSAVQSNIIAYIQRAAKERSGIIEHARIGTAISDTPGVDNYLTLLVNGGTENIIVLPDQVPIVTTPTITP